MGGDSAPCAQIDGHRHDANSCSSRKWPSMLDDWVGGHCSYCQENSGWVGQGIDRNAGDYVVVRRNLANAKGNTDTLAKGEQAEVSNAFDQNDIRLRHYGNRRDLGDGFKASDLATGSGIPEGDKQGSRLPED